MRDDDSRTAAELVTSVMHALLSVGRAPLDTLAALYREARFSSHPVGEDSGRAPARHCVQVQADLRRRHRAAPAAARHHGPPRRTMKRPRLGSVPHSSCWLVAGGGHRRRRARGRSARALGNAAMLLACARSARGPRRARPVALAGARRATDWSNTFTEGRPRPRCRLADHPARAGRATATEGDHAAAAASSTPTLTDLAVERLRDRRGLRTEADPEAAHTALGPDLTAYLTGPPTTRVTAAQLAAFITTLEEL